MTNLSKFLKKGATGLAQLVEIIPVAVVVGQIQSVVGRNAQSLCEDGRSKPSCVHLITRQRRAGQEAIR